MINVVYKLYNYLPNRLCSRSVFMMCLMLYYVEEKFPYRKLDILINVISGTSKKRPCLIRDIQKRQTFSQYSKCCLNFTER